MSGKLPIHNPISPSLITDVTQLQPTARAARARFSVALVSMPVISSAQPSIQLGLLKAIGATDRAIRTIFLAESIMLSAVGAVMGYALGQVGALLLRQLYPSFPAFPPDWAVLAGLGTALLTGIAFGVMPARRAARLDPVLALARH